MNGGYAENVVAPASVVVPKPPAVDWPVAGSILAVGGTAAHALQIAAAKPGETLLVHGAAGSVGQIAVQLAVQDGVRVIGTAGESNHDLLRGYGVIPVTYGPGLADRVRALAPDGVDAAIDTVGTDEAVDTSLELVADHRRIVSIAAFGRADSGIVLISGDDPETNVRAERLATAAAGCSGRLLEDRRRPDLPPGRGGGGPAVRPRRTRRREGRAGAVTAGSTADVHPVALAAGRSAASHAPRGHPRDSDVPRVTCDLLADRAALSAVLLMGSCQGFVEQ